jgi:hypothetical protein
MVGGGSERQEDSNFTLRVSYKRLNMFIDALKTYTFPTPRLPTKNAIVTKCPSPSLNIRKPKKLQLITVTARFSLTSHEATGTHTHTKVDKHNDNETHAKHGGSPLFIIHTLHIAALADLIHTPDVEEQTVDEGSGCEDGECPG